MQTRAIATAVASAFVLATSAFAVNPPALTYPTAARTNVVDDYHGTMVPDPYRWLEDDNSPETKAWVEAQNKVTFGYLETLPLRAPLKARLTALYNFER